MSKQQHPIDDLFRRELADYRVGPSQERRAAFLKEAGKEIPKQRWPGIWITGIITAVLIIGGLSTGILLYNQKHHPDAEEKAPSAKKEITSNQQAAAGPENNAALTNTSAQQEITSSIKSTQVKTNTENKKAIYATVIKSQPKTEDTKGTGVSEIKENTATKTTQRENNVKPNYVPAQAEAPPGPLQEKKTEPVKTENTIPPAPAGQPVQKTEVRDTREQITTPKDQPKEKKITRKEKTRLPKQWNIDMGVYYTPEWMFNTLNGDKFVNNTGVEGTFHFGPWSVRTGLGLSITAGYNEVLVTTNPYLGTYKSLDSIAFTWDNNYNLVSSYYTTNKEVFDTALQYTYTNYKKRYTYLQVPLILGYDFWQNRWLSLGVRGGAVMSVLLNTETLSGGYDPGKDKIVMINNVTPDRIQLNWQAVAGMNASFRLSRRFSIDLEPDLRYYFNSVYQSSDMTKKVWSVGIRSAFLITF